MSRIKIAVACYRFIGDTLLATPFLRALREQQPDAEIHLLVGPPEHSMMAGCPSIDAAIAFNPRGQGWWTCIQQLRAQQYQRVYLLKRSFSSALLMRLAGIPERIGFDTEHRGALLTRRVPYEPDRFHEAVCFLQLLQPANLPESQHLMLENWFTPYLTKDIQNLLPAQPGPKVVLHATSTNAGKCWPIGRFTELAKHLIETYHAQILFLGPSDEAAAYHPLIKAFNPDEQTYITNLCGQTTLTQSIALLTQVDLVVANDCGMTHMAAAAGVPVIALFGPSRPQQWHPLARHYQVVEGHGPMETISTQMVLDTCTLYLTS